MHNQSITYTSSDGKCAIHYIEALAFPSNAVVGCRSHRHGSPTITSHLIRSINLLPSPSFLLAECLSRNATQLPSNPHESHETSRHRRVAPRNEHSPRKSQESRDRIRRSRLLPRIRTSRNQRRAHHGILRSFRRGLQQRQQWQSSREAVVQRVQAEVARIPFDEFGPDGGAYSVGFRSDGAILAQNES